MIIQIQLLKHQYFPNNFAFISLLDTPPLPCYTIIKSNIEGVHCYEQKACCLFFCQRHYRKSCRRFSKCHRQASGNSPLVSDIHCHGSAGRSGLPTDSSSDEHWHTGSRMSHAPKQCPCHRDLRENRLPRRAHGCCRRSHNGLSGSLPALSYSRSHRWQGHSI